MYIYTCVCGVCDLNATYTAYTANTPTSVYILSIYIYICISVYILDIDYTICTKNYMQKNAAYIYTYVCVCVCARI